MAKKIVNIRQALLIYRISWAIDGGQTWSRFGFEFSFVFVRRIIPKSTWAEIRTADASDIGLREIARNMGISEGTVLAHAKREGWTQRIQSAKALAKRQDALAATPTEAVAIVDAATRRAPRRTHGRRFRAGS